MNIRELLNSTYSFVRPSGNPQTPSFVFGNRKFGRVYALNKLVSVNEDSSTIEVSMLISIATQRGVNGEVIDGAHRVAIQIKDTNIQQYTIDELIVLLQQQNRYSKTTRVDLVEKIVSGVKVIPKRTIMQSTKNRSTFVVIRDDIDLNSEVRVRCSCFTGDTLITLPNNEVVPIKELVGKESFEVIGYNLANKKFEIAKAKKCELKKQDTEVVKITFNDKTEVRCTPEHNFLLSNNMWEEATNLKRGTEVRVLPDNLCLKEHKKIGNYYVYLYLDPTKEGEYSYGDLSLSHEPFYVGKASGMNLEICSEQFYEKIDEIQNSGHTPILIKQAINVEECTALDLKLKLINKIGTIKDGTGTLLNSVENIADIINLHGKDNEHLIQTTKKVVKVEELKEKEDVYCMTVESLGNFTLANGVVVKNCADFQYTFNYYNANHKALIGKRFIYKPKRDKERGFTPQRNPRRIPGCCKHLMLFFGLLMDGKVIQGNYRTTRSLNPRLKSGDIKVMGYSDIQKLLKQTYQRIREDNKQQQALREELRKEQRLEKDISKNRKKVQ